MEPFNFDFFSNDLFCEITQATTVWEMVDYVYSWLNSNDDNV